MSDKEIDLMQAYKNLYKKTQLPYTVEDIFYYKNKNLTFIDRFGIAFRVKNKILCFSDIPHYVESSNQCWFTEDLFVKTFRIYQDDKICYKRKTKIDKVDFDNLTIFQIMNDDILKKNVFYSDKKYYKIIEGMWCYGNTKETIEKWNMPNVTLKELKRTYKLV